MLIGRTRWLISPVCDVAGRIEKNRYPLGRQYFPRGENGRGTMVCMAHCLGAYHTRDTPHSREPRHEIVSGSVCLGVWLEKYELRIQRERGEEGMQRRDIRDKEAEREAHRWLNSLLGPCTSSLTTH